MDCPTKQEFTEMSLHTIRELVSHIKIGGAGEESGGKFAAFLSNDYSSTKTIIQRKCILLVADERLPV